jgi:hypothetical protein
MDDVSQKYGHGNENGKEHGLEGNFHDVSNKKETEIMAEIKRVTDCAQISEKSAPPKSSKCRSRTIPAQGNAKCHEQADPQGRADWPVV